MKNIIGSNVTLTLFGESHGECIGAVLDGIPAGVEIDLGFIDAQLKRRKPREDFSTARKEADCFEIKSGVFNGYTTGSPICIIIPNNDANSADYGEKMTLPRPGHADYTAFVKYNGYNDHRGGGNSSGRLTAALTAAGAIALSVLKRKNIHIASHLSYCGGVEDKSFSDVDKDVLCLEKKQIPALCDEAYDKMKEKMSETKKAGDSIGGTVETAVTGLPAGVGEPWFDSLESVISRAVFSIPGVKGIEFGCGFRCVDMAGSEVNDAFIEVDGEIKTETNNNAGINGGISNGMPVIFRTAFKPAPSVAKAQKTVDISTGSAAEISVRGRHDSCYVDRAAVIVDSMTALSVCDLLFADGGRRSLGE